MIEPFTMHVLYSYARALSLIFVLCCSGFLTGCLVPNNYSATLYVSNYSYSFEFIGEMYMMLMYSDAMYEQSLDPKLIPQQIMSEFKRVITERKHTRMEMKRSGESTFQTAFAYSSPYIYPEASGLFNFKVEGKRLTITSRYMSPEDKALVAKNTIPSRGTVTIKAYGNIIESNAHEPATAIKQYSTWRMKDLHEPIKMVIEFTDELKKHTP